MTEDTQGQFGSEELVATSACREPARWSKGNLIKVERTGEVMTLVADPVELRTDLWQLIVKRGDK